MKSLLAIAESAHHLRENLLLVEGGGFVDVSGC